VDEHVLALVDGDEAVPLLAVEPLHGTLGHRSTPAVLGDKSRTTQGPGSGSIDRAAA
jgi:hypothetical protein